MLLIVHNLNIIEYFEIYSQQDIETFKAELEQRAREMSPNPQQPSQQQSIEQATTE